MQLCTRKVYKNLHRGGGGVRIVPLQAFVTLFFLERGVYLALNYFFLNDALTMHQTIYQE